MKLLLENEHCHQRLGHMYFSEDPILKCKPCAVKWSVCIHRQDLAVSVFENSCFVRQYLYVFSRKVAFWSTSALPQSKGKSLCF